MKILLIGGNGYIGSRLYTHLINRGYIVDNLDLCWYGKIFKETIVKNYNDLTSDELKEYSHIILLAGYSSVAMCKDIFNTFNNNVIYFNNLLEKLNSDQILIYASSCSVYGNRNQVLNETDDLLSPLNNYDFSKQTIERLVHFTSNKKCIGLRLGTVSGFSPNLRDDLVVNGMTLDSVQNNKIMLPKLDIKRSIIGIEDLCNSIEKIVSYQNLKTNLYNLISFSTTLFEIANWIKSKNGCEIHRSDKHTTNYSFFASNNKFKSDFQFKFKDTLETIYNDLIFNIDNIKIKSKRI